jgi:hypothetical protein
MRAAPSASTALAEGRVERVVISVLHALAGLVLAAWLAAWAVPEAMGALSAGMLVWLVAAPALCAGYGAWAARRLLLPSRRERLHWSGQGWFVQRGSAGAVVSLSPVLHLRIRIDLGVWLLLDWQLPGSGRRWAVLRADAAAGPAEWHAVRVALAAHALGQTSHRTP